MALLEYEDRQNRKAKQNIKSLSAFCLGLDKGSLEVWKRTYIKSVFLHGSVSGPKYPNLLKELKSSCVVIVPSALRHGPGSPIIAHSES